MVEIFREVDYDLVYDMKQGAHSSVSHERQQSGVQANKPLERRGHSRNQSTQVGKKKTQTLAGQFAGQLANLMQTLHAASKFLC